MPVKPGACSKLGFVGGRLLAVFGLGFAALGGGEELGPVVDAENVAGMAGAEEEQAGNEASRVDEEAEQFLAGDVVGGAVERRQLQEIEVAVTAPMHDMVAALRLDLLAQAGPGDAVGEDVQDDLAVGVDLFAEQAEKPAALPPHGQGAGAAGLREDGEDLDRLAGTERERLGIRAGARVDDADQEVAVGQTGLVGGGPGDLPGNAGESGGEGVRGLVGPGKLDAEAAFVAALGQGGEDLGTEHFVGEADPDPRDFLLVLSVGVVTHVLAQVVETESLRESQCAEIGLAVGDLSGGVAEFEGGAVGGFVGGDGQGQVVGVRHGLVLFRRSGYDAGRRRASPNIRGRLEAGVSAPRGRGRYRARWVAARWRTSRRPSKSAASMWRTARSISVRRSRRASATGAALVLTMSCQSSGEPAATRVVSS